MMYTRLQRSVLLFFFGVFILLFFYASAETSTTCKFGGRRRKKKKERKECRKKRRAPFRVASRLGYTDTSYWAAQDHNKHWKAMQEINKWKRKGLECTVKCETKGKKKQTSTERKLGVQHTHLFSLAICRCWGSGISVCTTGTETLSYPLLLTAKQTEQKTITSLCLFLLSHQTFQLRSAASRKTKGSTHARACTVQRLHYTHKHIPTANFVRPWRVAKNLY